MTRIVYDGELVRYEAGRVIHASDPTVCRCCGAGSSSSGSSSSVSESGSSSSVFDGDCCVYGADLAHCIQQDEDDAIGAGICTQCHSGVPTSDPGDPEANVWYSSSHDYDMSSGDWHVEVKACPIWYDLFSGRTYWPPIPSSPGTVTISTTTAAGAVLTSCTVTHDCSLSGVSNSRGCYDRPYNCSAITLRFEGTSNVPTCDNCPTCSGYDASTDRWAFNGWQTPHSDFPPIEDDEAPCGYDPWAMSSFDFGVTTDCTGTLPTYAIYGVACESCP